MRTTLAVWGGAAVAVTCVHRLAIQPLPAGISVITDGVATGMEVLWRRRFGRQSGWPFGFWQMNAAHRSKESDADRVGLGLVRHRVRGSILASFARLGCFVARRDLRRCTPSRAGHCDRTAFSPVPLRLWSARPRRISAAKSAKRPALLRPTAPLRPAAQSQTPPPAVAASLVRAMNFA